MSKQEVIDTMTAKYNRLYARYKDLERQTQEKQEKYKQLIEDYKINEILSRELCETILAKDPQEMVLGTEYSWKTLSTRDIISRSKQAFAQYNEQRTELMKNIQSQSEDRRQVIENLQTQIEQLENEKAQIREVYANMGTLPTFDQETGEIHEEISDKTKGRMPLGVQQAMENGSLDVLYDKDDKNENLSHLLQNDDKPPITEKDVIELPQENKQYSKNKKQKLTLPSSTVDNLEIIETNNTDADLMQIAEIHLEKSLSGIKQTPEKQGIIATAKAQNGPKIMQININEIEQKLKTRAWAIIEVIGKTGICEASEIIENAFNLVKEQNIEESITQSGFKHELMSLVLLNCLTMDKNIVHPLKSNFAVYSLSDIGRRLFISKFNKDPVVSEKDLLIKDHDNLEHAFGIKSLFQTMKESNEFTDITMDRRANTVRLKDGTSYIADISAMAKNRKGPFKIYMEYERGTHHQSDFNIKLNKAVKVGRFVNIVCPNNQTVDILKNKTAKWIESRNNGKNLPNVKVRITTLRRLSGKENILADENWQVVFDLNKGITPIERM